MAKALKFAAIAIGAVALIATGIGAVAAGGLAGTLTVAGVSTSTLLLVSGGLSVAAGLLQKAPKVTASQTDRLTANIDPRTFRKTVLGQTAMPVDVRYEEWSGTDQEICDWIVAFASHAIDGLDEIWFDTEMAWSATTGVAAKYNGYFSIPNLVLEGNPQNAFTFASGKWNRNTARLTGCAYARFRFKVTGNSKKAESPFSSGIPSRITVIGRGAKLYDPRRDSTVPGGSGLMRWNDQSTWRFTTDDGVVIGENLPLQILRVILGWRILNPNTGVMKLATGAGVPGRRISFPSFQIAANLADEAVNRSAGGTEPRYHGAGVISEGDDQKTVLDMLCSACCGRFRDTGGKLALAISHNDLAAAAVDDGLNDDDVVGAFTWDPDPSLEAMPNVVRGRYVDATSASLYQLIDYPEVRIDSPDGQDRFLSLDLGVVESPSHAQRVAKQVLQRRQYSRQFAAPFDIRAWKYTVGDVVPFTFAPLGFQRGVFRVKEQELGQGGTCNMVLTYETPAFYQWDADDSLPVQGAEPIVYDRGNNPLILAIDEAATTAFWNGVTGDGKPSDNATNSADPNSPFGSGTVGGTVNKLIGLDEAFAAARDQLYDAGESIKAINQAVSDANDAITAARSKAASDLAAAQQVYDGHFTTVDANIGSVAAHVQSNTDTLADLPNRYAAASRAAALEAQVNGDADSHLLGRANDQAIAIADAKVGTVVQSVKTLSAQILNTGANLLPNSSGENGGVNTGARFQWAGFGGPWFSAVSPFWGQRMENGSPSGRVIEIDSPRVACAPNTKYTASADLLLFSNLANPLCYVDICFVRTDGSIYYANNGRAVYGERDFGSPGFRDATWSTAQSPADAAQVFMRAVFASDQDGSHRVVGIRQAKLEVGAGPCTPYSQEGTDQQTNATLTQQAGAIAGIDGRTSVYWNVTGTTGDGSTMIQLSKSNGQPGQFYVNANMLIDGNLLVSGTVNTVKIGANAITQWAAIAGSTGEVGPDGGPTYSDPVTIVSQGGLIKIDVSFDALVTGGTGPNFIVALQRDGGSITRDLAVRTTALSVPNFFTLNDNPPAGTHNYRLIFGRAASGSSTMNFSSAGIFVQEFKR